MAVFYEATAPGAKSFWPSILIPRVDVGFKHPNARGGSSRAVLVALSYVVLGGDIDDLTRPVTYNDIEMESLGVQAYNNVDGGWLELFGLLDADPGGQVHAAVIGQILAPRWLRASSVSYTGVGSFGTITETFGTGTALTGAASAPAAGMNVQAFGMDAGVTGYTRRQRYLNTADLTLLMGDAAGTGSSVSFGATAAESKPWANITAVLNPADTVATAEPIIADPVLAGAGRRLARPALPHRVVFNVSPEN